MKGFGEKLLGNAQQFSFQQRIFNFAVLLGIFMTSFGTIMDLYSHVSIILDLVFIFCWVVTYYLSRSFPCYFHAISVISIGIFTYVFIPYLWIFSGGVRSIIPYYNIVFIAILSMILSGRFRILMIISILVVELSLILRDAHQAGSMFAGIQTKMNLFDFSAHIFVIMLSMGVLIVVYSDVYMKEKKRNENYAKTIEEQYHQQIYYMENLEQAIVKLKSERHDFNHHLGVIYGLLEGGETHQASEYVTRLVKDTQGYRSIVTIPYPAIRAMLNYKLSTAGDSGIRLQVNTELPEGLALAEVDMIVILGNLLDNAIEACLMLPEEKRYLNFKLFYKPDYLILQLENPLRGEEQPKDSKYDFGLKTTKQDDQNHGFGLKNIEYLVRKHDGFINIENDGGIFRIDMAIVVTGASQQIAVS